MRLLGPSGPPQGRARTAMAKRDYLVEAAKQIHMALDREVSEDYEAAFSYYKNGVDLLLNGVQGTVVNLLYSRVFCQHAGFWLG